MEAVGRIRRRTAQSASIKATLLRALFIAMLLRRALPYECLLMGGVDHHPWHKPEQKWQPLVYRLLEKL